MGDKNIYKRATPFTSENQPSKESRQKQGKTLKETMQKKRELLELLQLSLKGDASDALNIVLKKELNIEASTLEEALHLVQVIKALANKDTQAYNAIMQVSGLYKPNKVEHSGEIKMPIIYLQPAEDCEPLIDVENNN